MSQLALAAPEAVRSTLRTRQRDPLLITLAGVCLALIAVAAFGPLIAPYPPEQTDILSASQGPSIVHWLGTDALGRDIFSRILVGARLSFAGPILVVAVSTVLGTAIALASAWHGGAIDAVLSRTLNVVFAVPGILVAMIAVAVVGVGFWGPAVSLSIVYIPYVARVIRSAAIGERRRPYVEALELAGLSAWSINVRHILPALFPIVLAQATFGFGAALLEFGAISFIGLGIQPPAAEWGLMVAEGRSEMLEGAFAQSVSAGLAIVLTVVAFNMLGERLSHHLGDHR